MKEIIRNRVYDTTTAKLVWRGKIPALNRYNSETALPFEMEVKLFFRVRAKDYFCLYNTGKGYDKITVSSWIVDKAKEEAGLIHC